MYNFSTHLNRDQKNRPVTSINVLPRGENPKFIMKLHYSQPLSATNTNIHVCTYLTDSVTSFVFIHVCQNDTDILVLHMYIQILQLKSLFQGKYIHPLLAAYQHGSPQPPNIVCAPVGQPYSHYTCTLLYFMPDFIKCSLQWPVEHLTTMGTCMGHQLMSYSSAHSHESV